MHQSECNIIYFLENFNSTLTFMALYRTFLCMVADYPYAIKNQRINVFFVPKPLLEFGCNKLVLYGIRLLV